MAKTSVSTAAGRVFDRAYYRRYYEDASTRVATARDYALLARFIAAYVGLLGLPVASVLDLGAGTGVLLRALRRHYPAARLHGVDVSEHACERHGWERASVTAYQDGCWDLVLCNDVLQYLPPREAARAIANLAARCGSVLYFSALAEEDWARNCDRSRTDAAVHLRPAHWYASRLARHFRNLGGGLFLRRGAPATCFALHALD